jgi:hypothetical protein
MKKEDFQIPEFEDEDQEARWWTANPDLILARFESAASDGRLGRGSAARRGLSPATEPDQGRASNLGRSGN